MSATGCGVAPGICPACGGAGWDAMAGTEFSAAGAAVCVCENSAISAANGDVCTEVAAALPAAIATGSAGRERNGNAEMDIDELNGRRYASSKSRTIHTHAQKDIAKHA
jgi:hypothetical protein